MTPVPPVPPVHGPRGALPHEWTFRHLREMARKLGELASDAEASGVFVAADELRAAQLDVGGVIAVLEDVRDRAAAPPPNKRQRRAATSAPAAPPPAAPAPKKRRGRPPKTRGGDEPPPDAGDRTVPLPLEHPGDGEAEETPPPVTTTTTNGAHALEGTS